MLSILRLSPHRPCTRGIVLLAIQAQSLPCLAPPLMVHGLHLAALWIVPSVHLDPSLVQDQLLALLVSARTQAHLAQALVLSALQVRIHLYQVQPPLRHVQPAQSLHLPIAMLAHYHAHLVPLAQALCPLLLAVVHPCHPVLVLSTLLFIYLALNLKSQLSL